MTEVCRNDARRTIFAIQALRAFAAMLVLSGHLIEDIAHRFDPSVLPLMRLPWLSGVDVFFAISGFIMVHTSWSHFGEPGFSKTFMIQRLIRIVPMYFLFTTAMVVIVVSLPAALGETRNEPAQILSSYLFFPYRRAAGEIQPVLATGWTLNYEMFFYLLFALVLPLARRSALVALAGIFTGLVLIHRIVDPMATCLGFWTDPVILEFLAGALIGSLYQSGYRNSRSWLVGLSALTIALALFFARPFVLSALHLDLPRLIKDGAPALLLVVACTLLWPDTLDDRVPRILRRLGDSSYALYLSHPFVMRISAIVLAGSLHKMHDAPIALAAYAALVVIGSLVIGHLVHIGLEKPVIRQLITLHFGRSTRPRVGFADQMPPLVDGRVR